jgi:hypothetical protein
LVFYLFSIHECAGVKRSLPSVRAKKKKNAFPTVRAFTFKNSKSNQILSAGVPNCAGAKVCGRQSVRVKKKSVRAFFLNDERTWF